MKKTNTSLEKNILSYAQAELRPISTLLKFYTAFFVGSFLTLTVCPQFGIGPIGGGHGISAWIMPYGTLACGAYCGAIFMSFGTLLPYLILSKGELMWSKKVQFPLFFVGFVALFSILLTSKLFLSVSAPHESFSYYFAWIIAALMTGPFILRIIAAWRSI